MTPAPWMMEKLGTPLARPSAVHGTALGLRFTNPRFAAADRAVPAGGARGGQDDPLDG